MEDIQLSFDNAKFLKFSELKNKMNSLDLISFRGNDFISDFIIGLEKKQRGIGGFSHVGIVIKSDILPSYNGFVLNPEKIYVFESTFSHEVLGILKSSPDVIRQKGIFGVQLRDLEAVIPTYIKNKKTKIAWCKLINNPITKNNNDITELQYKFMLIFEEYHNTLYNMNVLNLFATMFPAFEKIRDGKNFLFKFIIKYSNKIINKILMGKAKKVIKVKSWQFCSELVANIYQKFGIIEIGINPKNITPVDFFGSIKHGIDPLVYSPIFIKL
jgi:hypothetical protein